MKPITVLKSYFNAYPILIEVSGEQIAIERRSAPWITDAGNLAMHCGSNGREFSVVHNPKTLQWFMEEA